MTNGKARNITVNFTDFVIKGVVDKDVKLRQIYINFELFYSKKNIIEVSSMRLTDVTFTLTILRSVFAYRKRKNPVKDFFYWTKKKMENSFIIFP